MAGFDAGVLATIAQADEVDVESHRRDGSTRRTIIWAVTDGDHAYVRSIKGAAGVWYRELREDADAALHVDGQRIPVRPTPVHDAAEIERVTAAFRAKYGHTPWIDGVVKPERLPGTLRLEAR